VGDSRDAGISPQDEEKIRQAIGEALLARPPTIGVIGTSGTGKSSTINAMFRTALPISHIAACTKEFRNVDLRVAAAGDHIAAQDTVLRVVDAPGLGEDIRRDPDYLTMYRTNLDRCDVILWVMAARNRAVALDQLYLRDLEEFRDRMVFGINQIDLVEPMDWSHRTHLPSAAQEAAVQQIVADRREKLAQVAGDEIRVLPYSAKYLYGLQELFSALIETCQKDRAWIFAAIKNFSPFDFLPEGARQLVRDQMRK
jgi:uncharacterized protein